MNFKFYDRNVAEGKNFLIFVVVFAIAIRLAYYFHAGTTVPVINGDGYLWNSLFPIFSDPLYSLLTSSAIVFLIAGIINYVNDRHAFIRRRTLLPSAIVILLFSCMPSALAMSPYHIAALSMVLILNVLFEEYNLGTKQISAYKVSFYIALGSFFAPLLLVYLPIMWICLMRVRSFGFKSFLASLFSVFTLYVPAFSYFYLTQNIEGFFKPFKSLFASDWSMLPVLDYDLFQFVILALLAFLFLIIVIDNLVNSFKDKIRIRHLSSVLTIVMLFSFLWTLFVNIESQSALFIGLAAGSLQIAHFFSLVQKKIVSIVFLICLLILLATSIFSLFLEAV